MESHPKSNQSQAAKENTSPVSRPLTRSEIESLRKDSKEGVKKIRDLKKADR
jgi:hypothetical protein